MTTPLFSILHATYGRPEKAVAAMRLWFERAKVPEDIEYIFACNLDDAGYPPLARCLQEMQRMDGPRAYLTLGDFKGSAPAWDAAAKQSSGQILIQAQDDLVPPERWDHEIEKQIISAWNEKFSGGGRAVPWQNIPAVLAVSDGYRTDALLCTAIMNRARYRQQGHFLFPGYNSVYSDDEHSVRAYADEAEGKCMVIRARDLVFRHEHAYHLKQAPDATYQRQNSAENYAQGSKLFAERNGGLMKWRTWS